MFLSIPHIIYEIFFGDEDHFYFLLVQAVPMVVFRRDTMLAHGIIMIGTNLVNCKHP